MKTNTHFFHLYMKYNYSLLLLTLAIFSLVSCKKEKSNDGASPEITGTKIAPDGFTYSTSKEIKVNIRLLTNNNQPIKGVVVSLFNTFSNSSKSDNAIFKAVSDGNGDVKGTVTIPSYIDTLVIEPRYIGLLSNTKALIVNNSLDAIIGGSKGFFGNAIPQGLSPKTMSKNSFTVKGVYDGINFLYPNNGSAATSTIQPNGRPNFLEPTQDVITSGLLALVNTALPENQP
ncbi:MAG: LruC protein, partial [Daejeonella sp.]|nr:LruC protein [Daejeonella sp.]